MRRRWGTGTSLFVARRKPTHAPVQHSGTAPAGVRAEFTRVLDALQQPGTAPASPPLATSWP